MYKVVGRKYTYDASSGEYKQDEAGHNDGFRDPSFDQALDRAHFLAMDFRGSGRPVIKSGPRSYSVFTDLTNERYAEYTVEKIEDEEETNLLEELRQTLDEVNKQIEHVKAEALNMNNPYNDGNVYAMRTVQGDWTLSPLLTTKASLLVTITELRRSVNK